MERFRRERIKDEKFSSLTESSSAQSHTIVVLLRTGVVIILCALIAGLGAGSFTILSNVEIGNFKNQFRSLAGNIGSTLDTSLANNVAAASLMNNMYRTAMTFGYVDNAPNITLPGFENIMNDVIKLASLRSLQFAPLVTAAQRKSWEAYAASHVRLLQGPSSLNHSTGGSWTVADGMFNFKPDFVTKVSAKNSIPGSTQHPDWLFPLWQVAPVAANAEVVMLENHEESVAQVDNVIATLEPSMTEPFRIAQDSTYRPSSVMYAPILSPLPGDNERIVGLSSSVFTWDEMFANAVPPSFGRVYCVMTTKATQTTFAFDGGAVSVLGPGDLHETSLSEFRIDLHLPSLAVISAPSYSFVLYPSSELHDQYITNTPRNVCIVVIFVIVFTALVVLLFSYYVNEREKQLINEVKQAAVLAASNEAVLESKKMYVRYISHEIRTPMNAASLGIQLLEQSLRRGPEGVERDSNLETLSDMRNAFDMALAILNDLLNFDKLESGTLAIEPSDMEAISYFQGSMKMLMIQAREKGIKLILDLNDISPDTPLSESKTDSHMILTPADAVYIDKYKMDQVMRNLISNAIKFTPPGKKVTVHVRKVPENLTGRRKRCVKRVHPPDVAVNPVEADIETGARGGNNKVYVDSTIFGGDTHQSSGKKPCGTLVVNVIDEGAGIAPENIKKLFKEIVQFNPGKLQGGGGSGLGMMISKGIVDLHGGDLSVFSEGEGKGTTFTLILPLYQRLPEASNKQSPRDLSAAIVADFAETNTGKDIKIGGFTAGDLISSKTSFQNDNIDEEEEANREESHPDDNEQQESCSLKLLIVDDSKLNRKMLTRLLEAEGHHCDEAEDGKQAVEMASTKNYDAILMDYVMPVMDGPTSTKELRDAGYDGAIFGVTGNALSADVATFIQHGANQVLVKPVDADGLHAAFLKHGIMNTETEKEKSCKSTTYTI